ncbi:YgjV family protein [Flammeovirga yaeyamensis]|uniref:YgjV family protein n=1 Tax=Flammeovirga yaeyamensis TaxID=367791 RepID=A0AAX1N4C4_9BACT|nr:MULTISPECIES: YgjV family protein [Flammeovirga]ANQ47703.1 YgjV family protein [Flammeovirga sp. MY04]MBB3700167.1 CHASE2 domain-containing sensor protein [Flammeovirga yaeyamensis]NMF37203.1 YgjV family protein [Flammeovirga yaeyamensis]QWG00892.1 YgjV family protein [Flammeovirga yaeyamensis]
MNPEYVGHVASVILMISFTLKKTRQLRIVNSIACLAFVAYGIMITAWPVIISNAFIAIVNTYYLIQMRSGAATKEES